ncbi:hypothetical protein E4U42_001349 [Claviceps africana]|uniref:Sphingomyelin phosphodiesterase n=1 Tax=Claviceps africana TaxID=83212 RepID=A0A8K0JED6_9HYPO|nr:hypothetical protein E4U42_001349 [Claviceps africana]
MLLNRMLLLSLGFTLTTASRSMPHARNREKQVDPAKPRLSDAPGLAMQGLSLFKNNKFINEGISCISCKELLKILKKFSASDHQFVAAGQGVCRALGPFIGIASEEICRQGVAEHGPLLAEVLRGIKDVDASDAATMLCNNFLQVCEVVSPKSNLVFPEPDESGAKAMSMISGRGSYKVTHFSDLHIDPLYRTGTSGECDNPVLCCRTKGDGKHPVGPFGYLKRCDAPLSLEESMYDAIQKVAHDAEITIFTGDIVERQVWHTTPKSNMESIKAAYERMKERFPQFCPAVGNHESSPANWFPKREMLTKKYNIEWLYSLLTKAWKGTQVGQIQAKHHRGRYVYRLQEKRLRIIGINTNLYYFLNLWLYRDPIDPDPEGQLRWLAQQLQEAERAGDRVWIVGHMPMGDVDAVRHSSGTFGDIVTRYNGTVSAMFFGHSHLDQYQITYAAGRERTPDTALAVSFVAPSLTPSNGFPAFRVYTVDEDSQAVLDATTYFANMSEASFQTAPTWRSLYDLKSAYGASFKPDGSFDNATAAIYVPTSAARWHRLTEEWEMDRDLFDRYWRNMYTGSGDVKKCDDECRRKEICMVRGGRAEDNCAGKAPGVKLGRRHDNQGAGEDRRSSSSSAREQDNHCGSSVLLDGLRALFDPDLQAKIREVALLRG